MSPRYAFGKGGWACQEVRSQRGQRWGLPAGEGDRWQCEDRFHSLPLVPGWGLTVKKGGAMGLGSSVGRVLAVPACGPELKPQVGAVALT